MYIQYTFTLPHHIQVAASHINADAIIHFGHACLSRVIRLPLLYVFYTYRLDAAQFVDAVRVKATACERLFVFYNAGYFYELGASDCPQWPPPLGTLDSCLVGYIICLVSFPFADNLKAACNAAGLRSIQFARLAVDREADKLCWHLNGDDLTDVPCVYIGRDDQTFFNLTLSLRTAVPEWLLCDPSALVVDDAAEPPLRLQSRTPNTTAWMRRRNYYIETCKDARTLGIVVGTLAARGYLDIVRHVQAMARHRNVRTYLISVGKVNPAKLANFMEIDCFVLVGCPENDLFTSRDFYKPLLSVYEVEMALNAAWQRQQAPDYSLEFADVLPAGRLHRRFDAAALATPEADAEESDVSLVTGRVRNVRVADAAAADDDADDAAGAVLLKRNHQLIGTGADGGALANRTWTGLDASLGNVKPALVEMGRSGLAIRYDEVDSTNK